MAASFVFSPLSPEAATFSQFLDQQGNPVSPSGAVTRPFSAGKRFSVPGAVLHSDVSYEFYPVSGRTYSEIVNSTLENGPLSRADNRRYPTSYSWIIGWTYDLSYRYVFDEGEGKVHVSVEFSNIRLLDEITVTLPTLLDDTELNPIEKTMWKNYFDRLLEREHDHIAIIRSSGIRDPFIRELEDTVYETFSYSAGSDIESAIDRKLREKVLRSGRELVSLTRKALNEYDGMTAGGTKHELREQFFRGSRR